MSTKRVAHFEFLCANPKDLTIPVARQTILNMFELVGVQHGPTEEFDRYIALFEDDGSAPDRGKVPDNWTFALEGEYRRNATKEKVVKVTQEKYWHEAKHLREPGHVSTVAPIALTNKTVVMVIGSRQYLAQNAELYFERYGDLRKELVNVLIELCRLEPLDKDLPAEYRVQQHNLLSWDVFNEKFYPGNFDALLAEIRGTKVMSTEDALALINQEGLPAVSKDL